MTFFFFFSAVLLGSLSLVTFFAAEFLDGVGGCESFKSTFLDKDLISTKQIPMDYMR